MLNKLLPPSQGDQGLRGIRGLHGSPGISGPSGPKVFRCSDLMKLYNLVVTQPLSFNNKINMILLKMYTTVTFDGTGKTETQI